MDTYYLETIRDFSDEYAVSPPYIDISCPPHIHRQLEILYVVKGQCRATVNTSSVILTDNQMAIADSYDVHAWETIGKCQAEYMIFPYNSLIDFTTAKQGKKLKTNYILDEELCLQFKMIFDIIRRNLQTPTRLIVDGLTKAFSGMILNNIQLERQSKTVQKFLLNDILEYVADNFTEQLTLETVAAHFAYSKYYFGKLFKQTLNCNFEAYVNMVRVQNVLHLVKNKSTPISTAILDSGFSSIPTFYRHFNKQYGCSITQYLKKQNQNANFTSVYTR